MIYNSAMSTNRGPWLTIYTSPVRFLYRHYGRTFNPAPVDSHTRSSSFTCGCVDATQAKPFYYKCYYTLPNTHLLAYAWWARLYVLVAGRWLGKALCVAFYCAKTKVNKVVQRDVENNKKIVRLVSLHIVTRPERGALYIVLRSSRKIYTNYLGQ